MGSLTPNYHSIADFRKLNPKALKATFKLFVLFLKDADLITGQVIAMDGTKIRASNSKKNNYNQKKIDRHLAYIEEKTNEYLAELDKNDAQEQPERVTKIQEKIERLKTNKIKYEELTKTLTESKEPQVSTIDPDSRALLVQGQVVEVCYNMQAAVDQKHNLVVATHTINRNDRNAMSDIALETKTNLSLDTFTAILDKGYHNGREIETCQKANITTIVATPTIVNSNEHSLSRAGFGSTTAEYMVSKFVYNTESDSYVCPAGSTLNTSGTWHKKSRERDSYQFKKYRTPDCKTCPVQLLCTAKADGRREIERSQYAEAVAKNKDNYANNKELYRKRQEMNSLSRIVAGSIYLVQSSDPDSYREGYNHTNLRGLPKVNGEMALIMTVYNMKRAINIMGIEKLLDQLKTWKPDYKKATMSKQKRAILRLLCQPNKTYFAEAA